MLLKAAVIVFLMSLASGSNSSKDDSSCLLKTYPTPNASPERFEPNSRTSLIGEQPNPWDLLQPQDVMSRHRGAKQRRLCGRLGAISLLSPG